MRISEKALSVGQPGYPVVSPTTVNGSVPFKEPGECGGGNLNWTRGITRTEILGGSDAQSGNLSWASFGAWGIAELRTRPNSGPEFRQRRFSGQRKPTEYAAG
jgi:hypothetical protein